MRRQTDELWQADGTLPVLLDAGISFTATAFLGGCGLGPLRALVVGEEWWQLYVSNFHEILTLYRQGGINFLGVFQNAAAEIEARYGRETARLWKKAVAHTLYRNISPAAPHEKIRALFCAAHIAAVGEYVAEDTFSDEPEFAETVKAALAAVGIELDISGDESRE